MTSPIILTYKNLINPNRLTLKLYTPINYLYLHLHSPNLHTFKPITHIFSQKKIIQNIKPNIII